MPANLLVAKRSYARLKAALKRPIRRTQLIDRRPLSRPLRRKLPLTKENSKRKIKPETVAKTKSEAVSKPEEGTIESDDDILNLTEPIDFDVDERGRLLRQSTLKPSETPALSVEVPDPLPPNSTDTTRRIVRIVKPNERPAVKTPIVIPACSIANITTLTAQPAVSSAKTITLQTPISAKSVTTSRIVRIVQPTGKKGPVSLGIQVKPKTVSIGIQVGEPSPELSRERLPNATTFIEPPLKAYWTHKINLPYPPSTIPKLQPQLPSQQVYQPAPGGYWVESQPQWYPGQFMPGPPSNFITQPPVYQPLVYQQQIPRTPSHPPAFNRKQRRNNVKRQKFADRQHQ